MDIPHETLLFKCRRPRNLLIWLVIVFYVGIAIGPLRHLVLNYSATETRIIIVFGCTTVISLALLTFYLLKTRKPGYFLVDREKLVYQPAGEKAKVVHWKNVNIIHWQALLRNLNIRFDDGSHLTLSLKLISTPLHPTQFAEFLRNYWLTVTDPNRIRMEAK